MGGKGDKATNTLDSNPGLQGLNQQASAISDPRLAQLLQSYSNGGMSLQDAISAASQGPNGTTNVNQLLTSGQTGTKAATDQVTSNPMTSGLYGQGGMQDQLLDEQKKLATTGYTLQPQDVDALSQSSDNIARQYGSSESSIAQALANRGLSAGDSGAAGVAYSGMQGNKLEALAQNQRQIANDRMTQNLQRLTSTRQLALQTGEQGQKALQDQFARNQQGFDNTQTTLTNSLKAGAAQQDNANEQFEQQQQTKGGLGAVLGMAAGTGVGAYAGGPQGAAVGAGLGKSIGGSLGK